MVIKTKTKMAEKKTTKKTQPAEDKPAEIILRGDMFVAQEALMSVSAITPTSRATGKFVYAVERNIGKLKSILRAIEKVTGKADEAFANYQNERYRLAIACGAQEVPDGQGGTAVTGIKDTDKFTKESAKLDKKYEAAIKAEEKRIQKANKYLEEEMDEVVDWHMTDYKNFPHKVNSLQRARLSFMINPASQEEMDAYFESLEELEETD